MVPSLSSHVAGVPGFPSSISRIVFRCVEYLASPRVHRWALGLGLQQRVRGTADPFSAVHETPLGITSHTVLPVAVLMAVNFTL